ncbi:MAG: hypothetical protein KJ826_18745 [Proteobacteria bacterium]|nr:hypothetical protein [Pseudomonadota bacterium]
MNQDTKNQLDKIQRKERTKNTIRLICVFGVLSALFAVIMIYRYSPGETTEVYGIVTGLNGEPVLKQGEILYFIVELDNGKVIEVRKPNFVPFKKNERVQLKETKSSMIGNMRYSFINYQKD